MEREVKFQKADFKKFSALMLKCWLMELQGKAALLERSAVHRRQPAGLMQARETSGGQRELLQLKSWELSATSLLSWLLSYHPCSSIWGERGWRPWDAKTSTVSLQLRSAAAATAEWNWGDWKYQPYQLDKSVSVNSWNISCGLLKCVCYRDDPINDFLKKKMSTKGWDI